jgi:hypothetical protein
MRKLIYTAKRQLIPYKEFLVLTLVIRHPTSLLRTLTKSTLKKRESLWSFFQGSVSQDLAANHYEGGRRVGWWGDNIASS